MLVLEDLEVLFDTFLAAMDDRVRVEESIQPRKVLNKLAPRLVWVNVHLLALTDDHFSPLFCFETLEGALISVK